MPTLPPVVVELKASITELRAGLGEAGKELDKLETHGASTGEKLRAGLAKGFAIGGAASTAVGGALLEVSEKVEQGQKQLETAITNAGGSYEEYRKQIGATVTSQEKFGHTAGDTDEALARLTTAYQDPAKALGDMTLVANIATVRHISLASAADLVVKAHAGSTKIFKQFGIDVKTNADGSKDLDGALALLSQRLSGQAAASADTFGGRIAGLRAHVTDLAAGVGKTLGPALTILGPVMLGVSGIIESGVVPAILSATVAAGPWILAIGAIVVAAYVIYRNWGSIWGFIKDTFNEAWSFMKDVVGAAWDWIKGHMDLIIGLAAPFLLPFYELYKHWDEVWGGVKAVIGGAVNAVTAAGNSIIDFFRNNWQTVLAVITGPVGVAVLFIRDHFDGIVGFVSGLAGRIASAASGMWDGIKEAFRSAINSIIRGWNSLEFKIPGIDAGPVHFGGFTLGVPNIPQLAAGALVRATPGGSLVRVGEGAYDEAVVPLRPGLGGVGGTVINWSGDLVVQGANDPKATAAAVREELQRFGRRNPNVGLA